MFGRGGPKQRDIRGKRKATRIREIEEKMFVYGYPSPTE